MSKKTLVIHPYDPTTVMLDLVYAGRGFTVIDDSYISDSELQQAISEHDRIIMLGHGTPWGLLNPSLGGYLIDETHVELLREKETISVWCNSDQFFRKHKMKGFHTGMIISEVSEAYFVLGESPLDADELYKNMEWFSEIIAECLDFTPDKMKDYVLKHYVADDAITQYNRKNIIVL